MKKKYPEIRPQFLKNKQGKITEVYLPYDVYESILEETKMLRTKATELLKKKNKK